MLDIKYIINNKTIVQKAVDNKNVAISIDELIKIYKKRNKLQEQLDTIRAESNAISKSIRVTNGKDKKILITKAKKIKNESAKIQDSFKKIDSMYQTLYLSVPNVPTDDTPIGKDDSQNITIKTIGSKKDFTFSPSHHEDLGVRLKLIDKERAAKISGSRFAYLKNDLVLLEFAIIQYVLGLVTNEKTLANIFKKAGISVSPKAFTPVLPPVFIRSSIFTAMGRLEPREDKYELPEDDQFLIGSAEHTIGPIHMNEILEEEDLPIRYIGFSTCFRREAGTYGKDMKGIIRMHQFDKIEMETFTTKENGLSEQQALIAIQEYIMSAFKLPYQVVSICTGDMGKPDAKQLDIETWMPSQGKYVETHSADYMSDYQARRLKTFVKRKQGKELIHMNDATAVAFGRTMAAIIENFQTKKGTILIPKVLRSFMFGKNEISNE